MASAGRVWVCVGIPAGGGAAGQVTPRRTSLGCTCSDRGLLLTSDNPESRQCWRRDLDRETPILVPAMQLLRGAPGCKPGSPPVEQVLC